MNISQENRSKERERECRRDSGTGLRAYYTEEERMIGGERVCVKVRHVPEKGYGLRCICELFSVSQSTAHKLRKSVLAPACHKNGGRLVVDVLRALELYRSRVEKKGGEQ